VGAENSNRLLLLRAKQLLKKEFSINSRINRKRKAGAIKVIRDQVFAMRRTSYSLMIRGIDDVKSFAAEIGFSISRKTQKLKDAIKTLAINERKARCIWERWYHKKGGEWVKRLSPVLVD
jgi:hypothetical protein